MLFCWKVMDKIQFQAIKANIMAALWPSLMWPPVLEAFYHVKTGLEKDFTLKLCLCEIKGGKAHTMIIQYCMPQRVGQLHIISCAEHCTATKFLHRFQIMQILLQRPFHLEIFQPYWLEILEFVCLQVLFGDLIQITSGGYKTCNYLKVKSVSKRKMPKWVHISWIVINFYCIT